MFHLIKPNEKYDGNDMPLEMMDRRKLIEQLVETTKKMTSENMELVSLDGNCPD